MPFVLKIRLFPPRPFGVLSLALAIFISGLPLLSPLTSLLPKANATPSYYPSGPQTNVSISTVTNGGWTLCWSGDYGGSENLSVLTSQCDQEYLLLAGGAKNSSDYLLLAAAPRSEVFRATARNATTLSNGSYWYYNTTQSMGFAPNATISQSSADVFDTANTLRLSWHLGFCGANKICGGWRVGSNTGLNGSTTFARAIYESNGSGQQTPVTPGAPAISAITPGDQQLSVAFSAPASNGGATITNYEYSTDNGSNWNTPNPAITTSPLVISGLTNTNSYNVKIRAVNSAGSGTASSATAAVPRAALTFTTPTSGLTGATNSAFSLAAVTTGGYDSTFSITSGSLPLGLTLNSSTGTISGTPIEAGAFPLTLRVNDSITTANTNSFTLNIGSSAGLTMYIKNQAGTSQSLGTPSAFNSSLCGSGITSTLDYSWGSGRPSINSTSQSGCNADGFTVYAKGSIKAPTTGVVTFCAISDDGFYLKINGNVIINNWIDQGSNSNCNATGTMDMVQDTEYPIEVWNHENGGGAVFRLLWSYAGQARIAVPSTAFTTGAPALTILTPNTGLSATKGVPYSLSVVAVGGTGTKSYSVTSGTLPAGLSLNSSTGVISGTPSGTTSAAIRVSVTAGGATAQTNEFTIAATGVPGAPTSVTLTTAGVSGDGKLKATWTAPADSGGSSITNYEIRFALSGVLAWSNWLSVNGLNGNTNASTEVVLTGLQNSKTYVVQVRAINEVGTGPTSESSSAVAATGAGASVLGAPLSPSLTAGDGRLTLNFTANPIVGANVSSSVLFNTMNETCNREDYWIVRSNVLTAHQFTAGGAANITKFEIRMGAGLQQYPSQIRIAFYENGANDTIGTRISGTLSFASSASNVAVYTGSISLSGAGTYWFQLEPTAAIANHYYCGTSSLNATGSADGWSQNRTKFAYIGFNGAATQYFAGAQYNYPLFRITAESAEAALNAITEYQYSLDGGTTWRSVAVGALAAGPSILVTGLTNGTTYDVRLRAVNSAGPGAVADLSTGRPGVGPSIPRDKALSLGNTPGQIVTEFKSPSTTGGLALTYQYRLKNSATLPASPTYYPSGPQTNVPVTNVTNGGWTLCYSDQYRTIANLSTILNACTGKYIMLAAGATGNANYSLLAAGEREFVFKPTGLNVTTDNNGTFWYYNVSKSMGFAPTSRISQSSADVYDRSNTQRMSWHLGHCGANKICGGWRVGSVTGLNGSTAYVRAIYTSNGSASQSDEGWGEWTTAQVTTSGEDNTLIISPITNDKTYSVQVRAVNELGNSVATVAQNIDARRATGPTITTQPVNKTLTLNQTGAFTLTVVAQAAGQETLSYQWFKGGTAIQGATNATYTVAGPIDQAKSTAIAGDYYVEVTGTLNNTSGTTRSSTVAVSVAAEPVIKTNPAVKNGTVGATYLNQLELNDNTGTAPLTWTLAPGSSLPAGLSLTSDGRIVGTPTISSAAAATAAAPSGSFAFNGTNSSLSIPASNDWATGTGDFTVEWWQYQTDNNLYPRIFTFGDIANNNLPLSAAIEGGLFYAWVGGTTYNFGNVGAYKNTWVHFALVRSGNTLRVYKNGTLLGTNNTTNSVAAINAPLVIGYKSNSTGAYGGFITNFHYVNGTALYNANFVTSTNVSAVANTKLLLLSSTAQTYLLDSGGANKTVTSNGVTFNSSSPRLGSSTKDALQNANFASPLVNDPTRGWAQIVRSGGNAVISGGGLVFSYGSSACTTQASARMGEVQQKVTISQPTTVTFKIKVDARLWNRIGAGYSNPCHDPYQVTLTTSGGATATTQRQFSTEANATTATNASNSLSNNNVLWKEWTLQVTTTSANEVLTISLFGLDSGYWAGNYGPKFYDAELSLANGGGGGGANASTTVIVTDANGRTASHTFTIDISPSMSITTKTLANAATGAAYSQTLTAEGGNGSYTWAVVGGANNLPGGLTLTSNGVLGGNVANDATSRSFTVQVTDGNGAVTTQSLSLTVASGLPGEPTGLTVGTVGDGTLPLTWTAPVNTGGSAITQYVIAYSAPKGTDPADTEEIDSGTITVSASGLTLPYNLTGLKNGRTYTINVKARNSSALGNASSNVTGKPVVVASAPTNLSMSLANGGLTVRWKKPNAAGGNPITSYKVQCSVDGTTWIDITDRITTSGDDSSVVAATGLTIGSAYNCRVAAVTSTGDGAFVATDSAITLATPPSAPRGAISNSVVGANITSAVQTPGRMTVTWSKSANSNGSAITSYVATVARNFGENNEIRRSCSVTANETDDTSGYSCTVLGIPKKGNFRIWVIAVNAIGNSAEITGDLSQSGASQTLTIPNGVNGATYALGRADFSIGATASSGLPAQYTSTTTSICTITNRGLVKLIAPGTCTVNVDQDGTDAGGNETEYAAATQATVSFTVSDRVPGTPRFNAVTPGNTSLTVTWFAPSNSGGTPTHYDIQTAVYDPNDPNAALTWSSSTVYQVSNAALSQQISGLTNATEYKVRIRARNGANDANASSWVVYSGTVTVYGVPAKPTISSFTSDAENGAATIEWSAPANNGSAITGYEVSATADGQTTRYCNTGGNATSCVIYGLSNKVQYSFVLGAQNIAGSSANSDAYLASIPGMSQTISLLTTPAADGWTVDSPSYQIQALTNSGATLTFATGNSAICTVSSTGSVTFVSAGACQITISQSGTGTRYEAATNVIVNFNVSPSAPSAPRITGFVSAGSGLTINWSAPSRTGGTITGYTLTASRDGSNTVTCTVNALTCEMNTLTKGLIYNFTLIATNAAGDSPSSTLRTAGWYAVPVAPVLSTATASNSDGRAIEVTWNKSASDGGSEISRYVVSATAGAVTKTCAVAETGSATSSCVIRDLRAGTQYAVTVKAENAVGLSEASNSLNVTPGIAQVVSISSPASSPVSKSFGDPDFRINASVDSGNKPIFASSDTNVCTVDANGRVRIVGVGTCVITVSHPGSSDANESQYKASNSATLTINIAAVAPSAPTLVRLTPGDAKVTVALTAPTSLGGGTLTTYEYSLDNGSTWVTPQSSVTTTSFEITGLTNDTSYTVRVRANNGTAGAQSNSLSATPYARPEAPLPLLATGGNGSVALSWTVPQTYSGTLLRYEIFRRVSGVGDLALVHSTANANTLSYSDSGLTAGTTYEYQVRAVAEVVNNEVASEVNGLFTNSSFATTFSAPSAPRNVGASATFTSSPSLAVTWLAPLTNGGSAVTGYTATASAGGQNFTCTANAGVFGCTIENLVAGTTYSVTVVATSAAGTSIASDPAATATPIDKPGAPTAVAVSTDLDVGSATITWTAPASNGGSAITSYVARAYLGNTATSTPLNCTKAHVDGTSSYSCTITGLAYKTSYVFAVAANNVMGTGELSTASTAVNLQRSQTITFNALSDVTWLTRSILLNARASSALGITYTATPAGVCTVSGSSLTIAGIGNCTVTATQDGANSAYGAAESVSQSFAVNATQPSAVTLISVIPGDALSNGNNRVDAGKLTVSWSTATELGGSASASYLISYATNPNFSDELSVTTNNTSIVLSDLTPGATFNIRIRVLTPDYQAGSEWSNLLQGTVLSVPSAPTGTAVTAGAGTLTVSWEALDQAANGGSPILGYRVKALLGLADNNPATCVTSGTSCVIGGLDGSQFYTVQIVAINALGESQSYEFADDYRPSAAQEITAAGATKSRSVGKHRIGASTNSGLPLTYTVVSDSPTDPVVGRSVCEVDANGELTFDLAGTCRVKISQNGRGNGNRASSYLPAADREVEFVVEADVPSNVLDFTLSSGDRSLTVSWNKPTQSDEKADGGRALKGYEVTWFASLNAQDQPLQTGEAVKVLTDDEIDTKLNAQTPTAFRAVINNPNTTSYIIENLSNGVYYTVIVRSINNGNLKSARS